MGRKERKKEKKKGKVEKREEEKREKKKDGERERRRERKKKRKKKRKRKRKKRKTENNNNSNNNQKQIKSIKVTGKKSMGEISDILLFYTVDFSTSCGKWGRVFSGASSLFAVSSPLTLLPSLPPFPSPPVSLLFLFCQPTL